MCDAVIAVGGGAGTLSEIALAWQMKKMIICLGDDGWHSKLVSLKLDHRREDSLFVVDSSEEAVALISERQSNYNTSFKGVERKQKGPEEASKVIGDFFSESKLVQIGSGSEGYIFRGSRQVFKYFHSLDNHRQLYWMLLAFSERIKEASQDNFFDFEVILSQGHLITYYNDFESRPYRGGEPEKVIAFLRAIKEVGWVMNNFKAVNFRVNLEGKLVCVDLGASFCPISKILFRQMCMRAFLTIHFPFHPQIKSFYSYTNSHDDFGIVSNVGVDSSDFLRKFNLFYQKIVSE